MTRPRSKRTQAADSDAARQSDPVEAGAAQQPDPAERTDDGQPASAERARFEVRLPGFVPAEREVGLGDAIKRATSLLGVKPCRGCSERAAALNSMVSFSGRRRG
jgi:hypothetical protein